MPREPHELGVFVQTIDYLPCPNCRGTGRLNSPGGGIELHHACNGTGVIGVHGEMDLDDIIERARGEKTDGR